MSARPDLSALKDKELNELGAAIYDMHAAMLRLAYYGLIDLEGSEDIDIGDLMRWIDFELRLRRELKRAVRRAPGTQITLSAGEEQLPKPAPVTVISAPTAPLPTFADVIKRGRYVILDTETTGLEDGEICQIAIVDQDGEILLDTLVKTARPIPTDARAIHGISTEMVQSAPTFAELRPTIIDLLTGKDVIVYNAVYDRKMLHQSAEKASIPAVEWKSIARWWCAMEAFAPIYGEWNPRYGSYKWKSLSAAARYYSVEVQDAHTALGDCVMTLAVVRAMADGKNGVK